MRGRGIGTARGRATIMRGVYPAFFFGIISDESVFSFVPLYSQRYVEYHFCYLLPAHIGLQPAVDVVCPRREAFADEKAAVSRLLLLLLFMYLSLYQCTLALLQM